MSATLPPSATWMRLRYPTRTGAILRVNGEVGGAFDREHHDVELPPSEEPRQLELEVERVSLPTNGLPSGRGIRWSVITRLAQQKPRNVLRVEPTAAPAPIAGGGPAVFWAHAHLDVAWLWDYTQAQRKAVRTFANATALADREPSYVYMQSQPQLYEFVRAYAPGLFARVTALARDGRFDPDVAALWVEPDANVPSGESLLMQMLYAHRYVRETFGTEPSIAWLPDTFGFPNTLPTLLAHAGVPYFATTKLQWNDTTRFPYPQFRWRGPDGSEVVAAMLASYEGSPSARRRARAQHRREPVVVGYGDGGGGPTYRQLVRAAPFGHWERPRAWFDRIAAQPAALPVHEDELYLEYHRGTYTTHHDCKKRNAECERRIAAAQEQLAWCIAVHAPREVIERLRDAIDEAWRAVLCNQFHDVLAGAAIRDAYVEAHEVYDRAEAALSSVESATAAMLPRAPGALAAAGGCAPSANADGTFVLDNGILRAAIDERGTLHEISTSNGRSVLTQGNLLTAYRDKPFQWDAWNLDRGYDRHRERVVPQGVRRLDDGLEFRFLVGRSPLTMRLELRRGEPFLRVRCAVDWQERHVILRVENWIALQTDRITYGSAHGTVVRTARRDTAAQRARFEVPGHRFARVEDQRGGLALLTLDTYGWSARTLPRGGLHLGHSLLRSPTWPDPQADRGSMHLEWAFAPFDAGVGIGTLERAWERFAMPPRVRLFESEDGSVVVAACKPAEDGEGIVLRVRECDGTARRVQVRCGARMRSVESVDALERSDGAEAAIEGECVVAPIDPHGLRSFRIRF